MIIIKNKLGAIFTGQNSRINNINIGLKHMKNDVGNIIVYILSERRTYDGHSSDIAMELRPEHPHAI